MTVERIVVTDVEDRTATRRDLLVAAVDNDRIRITELWSTVGGDTFRDGAPDNSAWSLVPPVNGTSWRLVEFKPGRVPADITEGMHGTETIDLGIVLSGSIDLVLDDASTLQLSAGDNLVLRGSRHAWRNTGTEPCVMSFLLVRSSGADG